jgi:hypothetical protein
MGKPYLKITFLKESQDKETPMKRISHDLLYLTLNQPKFHTHKHIYTPIIVIVKYGA